MGHWLGIMIGGGLGSLCRYGLASAVYATFGRDFPWGTLAANILGCFLIGVLTIVIAERQLDEIWRTTLVVGFLGGFTTFSSFSLETIVLLQNNDPIKALLNILLSIGICLLSTWVGMLIAKH